jgi:hypothetical protein
MVDITMFSLADNDRIALRFVNVHVCSMNDPSVCFRGLANGRLRRCDPAAGAGEDGAGSHLPRAGKARARVENAHVGGDVPSPQPPPSPSRPEEVDVPIQEPDKESDEEEDSMSESDEEEAMFAEPEDEADDHPEMEEAGDDPETEEVEDAPYVPTPMPDVRAVVERFIRESCTRGPGLTVASRKFLSKLHEGLEDTLFFTAKRIGMILTDLRFAQVTVRDGRLCRGFRGLALNP